MSVITSIARWSILPTSWVIILLGFSILLQWRGRRRCAMLTTIGAFFVLLAMSTPAVVERTVYRLEHQYPTKPIEEYPEADAIVVLGGTTASRTGARQFPEENNGSRVITALRLFRAGKATTVTATGGLAYKATDGSTRTEADDIAFLLEEFGVPADAIVREREAYNTFENARNCAEILRHEDRMSILLVTSALHMPRAVGTFRKQGFEVIPVPCSHLETVIDSLPGSLVPNPKDLAEMTQAIREYVGVGAYRLRRRM